MMSTLFIHWSFQKISFTGLHVSLSNHVQQFIFTQEEKGSLHVFFINNPHKRTETEIICNDKEVTDHLKKKLLNIGMFSYKFQ